MFDIAFTSITGCRNRGVEALAQSMLQGMQGETSKNLRAAVLSRDPKYDQYRLANSTVLPDAYRELRGGRRAYTRRSLSRLLHTISPEYSAVRSAFSESRVVIALGGDVFSSDYGTQSLKYHISVLRLAQRMGLPTALVSQSIGPFASGAEVEMFRNIAMRAQLITVREERSLSYVVEELEIPQSRVQLTADLSFSLQPAPPEQVSSFKASIGLGNQEDFVVLAVSKGIEKFAAVQPADHMRILLKIVQNLHSRTGLRTVIIPHVHDSNPLNDDRVLASQFAKHSEIRHLIVVAEGDWSASQFKGLIGNGKLVIGERMHACLAGLSSGVPTAAVGYSAKAPGIFESLLGSRARETSVVSLPQLVDGQVSVADFVERNWLGRSDARQALHRVLPRARSLSERNFHLVAPMLDRN